MNTKSDTFLILFCEQFDSFPFQCSKCDYLYNQNLNSHRFSACEEAGMTGCMECSANNMCERCEATKYLKADKSGCTGMCKFMHDQKTVMFA